MRWFRIACVVLAVTGLSSSGEAGKASSSGGSAGKAEAAAPYEAVWSRVDLSGPLPEDLVRPEGKNRWELEGLRATGGWTRVVQKSADGLGLEISDLGGNNEETYQKFVDARAEGEAARWLMPHRDQDLANPNDRIFQLNVSRRGIEYKDWIRVRRVGIGWLHLPRPAQPQEVVLQRADIERDDAAGVRSRKLVYRWINPRGGVVAEAWGTDSGGGLTGLANIEGAAFAGQLNTGVTPLKIYADQIDLAPHVRLAYGFDRQKVCKISGATCNWDEECTGSGDLCVARVVNLTAPGYSTIGDLINASSWNFFGATSSNSSAEWASTATTLTPSETCAYGDFDGGENNDCDILPNANLILLREDRSFNDWRCRNNPGTACRTDSECSASGDYCRRRSILSITERQNRPADVTVWSRAGLVNEGRKNPFFELGTGESRYCHGKAPGDLDIYGRARPEVPLFRFGWQDTPGGPWYMRAGDSWSHTPFACVNDFFAHTCTASCGSLCRGFAKSYTGYAGTHSTQVIKEGPVTLPSGHTFQTLLLKTKAEFGSWGGLFPPASCSGAPQKGVRTVVYIWVTPYLGTLVRLQSEVTAPDDLSFTILDETDIKYGLFPPLSVTVTGVTNNSVSLSWNPGFVPGGPANNRIKGYNVYWGTSSGLYGAPQFVSGGAITSATIAGLAPGQQYFITVTSLSDFTNPATNTLRTYESLKYPTSVPTNDAGGTLPVEVQATTACTGYTPQQEVSPTGLRVTKAAGNDIRVCWTPSTEACLLGYRIIGSDNNASDVGWTTLADAPAGTNCHTLPPASQRKNYLVIARGPGGTGPWGHYGH